MESGEARSEQSDGELDGGRGSPAGCRARGMGRGSPAHGGARGDMGRGELGDCTAIEAGAVPGTGSALCRAGVTGTESALCRAGETGTGSALCRAGETGTGSALCRAGVTGTGSALCRAGETGTESAQCRARELNAEPDLCRARETDTEPVVFRARGINAEPHVFRARKINAESDMHTPRETGMKPYVYRSRQINADPDQHTERETGMEPDMYREREGGMEPDVYRARGADAGPDVCRTQEMSMLPDVCRTREMGTELNVCRVRDTGTERNVCNARDTYMEQDVYSAVQMGMEPDVCRARKVVKEQKVRRARDASTKLVVCRARESDTEFDVVRARESVTDPVAFIKSVDCVRRQPAIEVVMCRASEMVSVTADCRNTETGTEEVECVTRETGTGAVDFSNRGICTDLTSCRTSERTVTQIVDYSKSETGAEGVDCNKRETSTVVLDCSKREIGTETVVCSKVDIDTEAVNCNKGETDTEAVNCNKGETDTEAVNCNKGETDKEAVNCNTCSAGTEAVECGKREDVTEPGDCGTRMAHTEVVCCRTRDTCTGPAGSRAKKSEPCGMSADQKIHKCGSPAVNLDCVELTAGQYFESSLGACYLESHIEKDMEDCSDVKSEEFVMMCDFVATDENQLSLSSGDKVRLITVATQDWWWVEHNGSYGYVPSNHLCESDELDDPWQDDEYYGSYETLKLHLEMLSDLPRTKTYQEVVRSNSAALQGKCILDLGCGTGIISFFCAKLAQPEAVFAVEASEIAQQTRRLVEKNGFSRVVHVIEQRVEEVELPTKVDVLVSEWMGTCLLFEFMLESVLMARDIWLKEDGIMWPSTASIHLVPCSAAKEYDSKITFWDSVFQLDFSPLKSLAVKEFLCKPKPDYVLQPEECLSEPYRLFNIDMKTVQISDLERMSNNFIFYIAKDGNIHGFTFWFSVQFHNIEDKGLVELDTGPFNPLTHWKHTLFMLDEPLHVKRGDRISGTAVFHRNPIWRRHMSVTLSWKITNEELDAAHIVGSKEFPMWR
ncbi:arginine N-methyltransferase 2 isoform X1 [Pelobates cultripes]|uniref:Protein arginine N-methyltransferase 2 n=1 Tax=Pelobates cultripes TaxID=61616 RepID=A0AAD1SQE6_PELCU|nr:arginine N-methyltransferase 2 isoform X1 [Pelobates cultripes]